MNPPPAWACTWLEHWPTAVRALSWRGPAVALAPATLCALGRRNGVQVAAFGPVMPGDALLLQALARQLDEALATLPGRQALVRLGSRSPKDTPAALLGGLCVRSGADAVALLAGGSARVAFDLRVALQAGLTPWVHLRPWQAALKAADEWRLFLHAGQPLGLCPALHPRPRARPAGVAGPALRLAQALAAAWGSEPVVADLWLPPRGEPVLIELNPWGPPTDPGLFDWARGVDGTLRWRDRAGRVCREPLTKTPTAASAPPTAPAPRW